MKTKLFLICSLFLIGACTPEESKLNEICREVLTSSFDDSLSIKIEETSLHRKIMTEEEFQELDERFFPDGMAAAVVQRREMVFADQDNPPRQTWIIVHYTEQSPERIRKDKAVCRFLKSEKGENMFISFSYNKKIYAGLALSKFMAAPGRKRPKALDVQLMVR